MARKCPRCGETSLSAWRLAALNLTCPRCGSHVDVAKPRRVGWYVLLAVAVAGVLVLRHFDSPMGIVPITLVGWAFLVYGVARYPLQVVEKPVFRRTGKGERVFLAAFGLLALALLAAALFWNRH